jgi:hypothetical protein
LGELRNAAEKQDTQDGQVKSQWLALKNGDASDGIRYGLIFEEEN